MTSATQTDLFSNDSKPLLKVSKHYTVQKYRLSYVKEKDTVCSIKIRNNKDVDTFFKEYLANLPIEKFVVIALDSGNNIIGYDATEGSPNQCAVYSSNIFRFLLNTAAVSFIIAHNHPGGSTNPSSADLNLTKRLLDTGKLLEIPLLDHLIYTETESVSLRQHPQWPN